MKRLLLITTVFVACIIVSAVAFGATDKIVDLVGTWCGPMDSVYTADGNEGTYESSGVATENWFKLTINHQELRPGGSILFHGVTYGDTHGNLTVPDSYFSGSMVGNFVKLYFTFPDAIGVGENTYANSKGERSFELFILKQGLIPESSRWLLMKDHSGLLCP